MKKNDYNRKFIKIKIKENNITIANKVLLANTFWLRFKGLMFKSNLNDIEGILLYPCKMIHMLFMIISIDAIIMDINKKIIATYSQLKPWIGLTRYHNEAYYILETKTGIINQYNLQPGLILEFTDVI